MTARSPAARLARRLRVPHLSHLDDVYARVTRAMGRREPQAAALRVAAVIHELPPARIAPQLRGAGCRDVARLVSAIVRGFGEIWKARGATALGRYVRRHHRHLRALLLFEVAHEGAPTAAMRQAAALAGLERALAAWTRRLARPPRAVSSNR